MADMYLIMHIGPAGLKWTRLRLTGAKPDPKEFTHGEGQCLVFKLDDWDCSMAFAKAIEDGVFIKDLGEKFYDFDFDAKSNRDPRAELADLDRALDASLFRKAVAILHRVYFDTFLGSGDEAFGEARVFLADLGIDPDEPPA